jgi:hypothetical protein
MSGDPLPVALSDRSAPAHGLASVARAWGIEKAALV